MTDLATVAQAQRNADTVRRMYQAERERDIDAWTALWNPEGRQTFAFGGPPPVQGIEALRASTAEKFATRGPVTIADAVWATLDPHVVFAIADVSIVFDPARGPFQAQLWCRFDFDDDGRILVHEEVLDTAMAASFFAGDN